jgi:hypothetical protein
MGLTRGRTRNAIQDQFDLLPVVAKGQEISLFHPDDLGFELLCPNPWNDCKDKEQNDVSGKPSSLAHRERLSHPKFNLALPVAVNIPPGPEHSL